MQVIQVLQTRVVPLIAYLLGGWGAWLVVQTPAINPAAIVKDAGARTRWRGRIVLWLILAGLMAAPFEFIAGTALSWINLLYAPPDVTHDGFTIALAAFFSVGLALAYLAAWLLFQRIRWAGVASATGWQPTHWQRLFLLLAFGLFLTWPVTVSVQLITGLVQSSSATAGRDVLFARQVRLAMVQSVIAYGLGVWAAGRGLRRMAGRPDRFLTDGRRRLVNTVLFIALAGGLAEGVQRLLSLLNDVFEPILYSHPGFLHLLAGEPARTVLDITLGRLTLSTLPLLAYLLAILVMRRINWRVVEERSGWRPLGLEKALVSLTLGAWLGWPFELVGRVVFVLLPASQPGFAVTPRHLLIASAAVVLLYLLLFYRPGAGEAEEGFR